VVRRDKRNLKAPWGRRSIGALSNASKEYTVSGTYTKLIYHAVFSTKHRRPVISEAIRNELHRYLGGIIHHEGGHPIQIGGVGDHVHLLFQLKPAMAFSNLMQHVKASSSKWMSDRDCCPGWSGWQEGYAAFSVSESQVERLRKYIAQQEAHHRRLDFKTELRALLMKHGIQIDEERIWD
jgi:putative transposase